MRVLDSFKLSTKKFALFYEFERLWLLLTAINIIAIFLIIRGSTAPLLVDNSVLEFFFCTDKAADKTLYSIAISYFAAYIFYLIQIYYPERKKTFNALLSVRTDVHGLLLWLYRFLFVLDIYKEEDDKKKGLLKGATIKTIYIKDDTGFVYMVDRYNFKNMVQRIDKDYNSIINDPTFQSCDYSLKRLLLSENISNDIKRMYEKIEEAEALDDSSTILIGYPKEKIKRLKYKMSCLEKLFDIKVGKNHIITNESEDIEPIKNRHDRMNLAYEQNKAFLEVLSKHHKNNS